MIPSYRGIKTLAGSTDLRKQPLIWYLNKHKDGPYCTLPHAIELTQTSYDRPFAVLMAEADIQTLLGPFIEVWKNKTFEVLDSQLSSVKIPLGRLASPDLYYILTGNDLTLDINDPEHLKVLCLGGDPAGRMHWPLSYRFISTGSTS